MVLCCLSISAQQAVAQMSEVRARQTILCYASACAASAFYGCSHSEPLLRSWCTTASPSVVCTDECCMEQQLLVLGRPFPSPWRSFDRCMTVRTARSFMECSCGNVVGRIVRQVCACRGWLHGPTRTRDHSSGRWRTLRGTRTGPWSSRRRSTRCLLSAHAQPRRRECMPASLAPTDRATGGRQELRLLSTSRAAPVHVLRCRSVRRECCRPPQEVRFSAVRRWSTPSTAGKGPGVCCTAAAAGRLLGYAAAVLRRCGGGPPAIRASSDDFAFSELPLISFSVNESHWLFEQG